MTAFDTQADEAVKVAVRLRWSGNILFAGRYTVGRVEPPLPANNRMRGIDGHPEDWIAAPVHGYGSYHATETEARAALETAVIKSLEWQPSPGIIRQ